MRKLAVIVYNAGPDDLVIGITVVRADGAVAKAGGKVVASGNYPTGENGRTRLSNVPLGFQADHVLTFRIGPPQVTPGGANSEAT